MKPPKGWRWLRPKEKINPKRDCQFRWDENGQAHVYDYVNKLEKERDSLSQRVQELEGALRSAISSIQIDHGEEDKYTLENLRKVPTSKTHQSTQQKENKCADKAG